MNILKSLANFIAAKSYSGQLFQSVELRGGKRVSAEKALSYNELSLYLNRAVDKLSSSVGQIEFKLMQGDKEVEQNEWLDLLNRPNNFMVGTDFWSLKAKYKFLTGASFFWKKPGIGKVPDSLHLLRPDFVAVNWKGSTITGYVYTPGDTGKPVTLPPEQITYDYHPDPRDPRKAISMIAAGRAAIETDIQISDYQNSILRNGGRISGVFTFKTPRLTADQLLQLKNSYQDQYAGSRRSGLPLFLGSDAKYQELGLKPSEIGYLESKKTTLEDITILTGVPKTLLGAFDDIKYSNALASEKLFIRHTVIPLVDNLVEVLNQQLLPEGLQLSYVDPTPADSEETRADVKAGWDTRTLTTNERRKLMGFDPVPGGDTVGVILDNQSTNDDSDLSESKKKEVTDPRDSLEIRKAIGLRKLAEMERLEKANLKPIRKFFELQSKRVLARMANATAGATVDTVFDAEEEKEFTRKLIYKLDKQAVMAGGQATVDSAGAFSLERKKGFEKVKAFNATSVIEAWLVERAALFADLVTPVTAAAIQKIFTDAYNSDAMNVQDEITDRLQDLFDDYESNRARTWAHTETHAAFQKGSYEGFLQSGLLHKSWVDVGDSRVRPGHVANAAQGIIPIDQPFQSGAMYPGDGGADDSIGCRCQLA